MRKNLLVAALGAIFGSIFTYFVKDDQIIELRRLHIAELRDEEARSFNRGWEAARDVNRHPHYSCIKCHPPIKV